MRSKAREREKQCSYCDRSFTKEEHLKRHERSHTGEKPFKCHKCDRRYGRSDVLVRHLQIHRPAHRIEASYMDPPATTTENHTGTSNYNTQTTLHNPFQPLHQAFLLSEHEQSFVISADTFPRGADHQAPFRGLSLSDINVCLEPGPLSPTQQSPPQQHTHAPGESGDPVAVYSTVSNSLSNATHQILDRRGGEDWHLSAPLPQIGAEQASTLNTAACDGNIQPMVDPSSSTQTTGSGPSFWQIFREQESTRPEFVEDEVNERSHDSELADHHSATTQPFARLLMLSQLEQGDRCTIDPFLFNTDFSAQNFLDPGILDYPDFAILPSPISNPSRIDDDDCLKPENLFSADQLQRIRQLWHNQRAAPAARIIRDLWHSVIQHQQDNIFSQNQRVVGSLTVSGDELRPSRWGIDEDCRKTMIEFCKELDANVLPQDLGDLTPRSTPSAADSMFGLGIPSSSVDGFPTTEVLDASLDLFFQCLQLPFLHKATFNAKRTPKSLLLPVCLVGLTLLYPERSRAFVLQYQKRLMSFCRNELTSKALGRCQTWELLAAIASTLLVVYLGLGYLEDLDECQAHMLSVQMLHIAEKHGLFAAADGDDLTAELQAGPADPQGSWKAWGRVESVKRMIHCLLWMDMAYTRVMGSAGVVDMDKVELERTCEAALFEAPTSSKFLLAAQRGALLMAPRMRVRNFHTDPPPTLDHISMETLLVSLYLQTAAIRHKLPIANQASLDVLEIFSRSSKAKDVVKNTLLLPWKYSNLFQHRHRVTAFAWNNVCLALTADLNILELASGREGLEPARTAMLAAAKWAQTPSARRAVLHAAQIFDILSSSRLNESNIARPDLLLFHSTLVLSMYFSGCSQHEEGHDSCAFELLQDVDWAVVAAEGMRGATQTIPSSPHNNAFRRSDNPADAARDFIRYGGLVSFAGEVQQGGGVTARKILLQSVCLLDDLGKWRGSKYSQLLRTMSDFVIEGNH